MDEKNNENKTGRLKTVWQTPSCMIILGITVILFIAVLIGLIILYKRLINVVTNNIKVEKRANLNYPRYDHVQVKLDNGNIFIIGGYGKNEKVQYQPELYLTKQNKFIKLAKTDCRYQNPKVLMNNIGNLLITEATCPKNLIFDIYTQQFSEVKKNESSYFKDIKNDDELFDLKKNKNSEMEIIASDYNSKNFEGLKAIKFTERYVILMCDKFPDKDFQNSCIKSWGFDLKNSGHFFWIPEFKYSPINGKITKIDDAKFILIGGSHYNSKGENVPHNHSQIIYIKND